MTEPQALPEREENLAGQMAFFPELESGSDQEPQEPNHRDVELPAIRQMERWMNSILVCDILLRFEDKLPADWLYEIFVGSGHFSYFVYMDALGAAIEMGGVVEYKDADGTDWAALTPAGRRSVRRMRKTVPKLFRDRVHLTALRYVARQRALKDLQISYEPAENGDWTLSLRCTDNGREMLALRLLAPDRENAEMLGERILRNPSGFFGRLFDLVLNNEEEQYDLTDN